MLSHFFLFRFCIWRGFKNKSEVCHILFEELFLLDGRPHIAKLMLKRSLVSSGDSRMKQVGGHCGAKEKFGGQHKYLPCMVIFHLVAMINPIKPNIDL